VLLLKVYFHAEDMEGQLRFSLDEGHLVPFGRIQSRNQPLRTKEGSRLM